MDFLKVIHSINLSSPSWDMYVLLIFIIGIAFYLLKWGRGRAFWILVSGYVSLALVSKLLLIEKVSGVNLSNTFTDKTIVFLAATLVLYFLFIKSDFVPTPVKGPKSAWFQVLVISFLQIGFLISVIVSFVPAPETKHLSVFLQAVFLDSGAQFFWLLSPFLAIFLLKDK